MTFLPSDPGDLFAELYDRLPERIVAEGVLERWILDDAIERRAREIEDRILEEGSLELGTLEWLALAGPTEQFAALRGIDAALERISPFTGTTSGDCGALGAILARHADSGVLNTGETEGAVLFRCAFPGRPPGLPTKEEAFGLIRVSGETWEKVNFRRIPIPLDVEVAPSARLDNLFTLGCSPLLESYDEFEIAPTWRRGRRPAYRIAPTTAPARGRIPAILETAEAKGAVVVVAPESTLNREILKAWREELRGRVDQLDTLTWILAGSGPDGATDPPVNRAVLLHVSGETLIEQDKMHDFTLTPKQIRHWRLPGLDMPGPLVVRRVEDIARGTKLEVRESALGRLAIMICEDLTRSDLAELVRCVGVSHIFVPVFSTEPPGSWAQFKSGDRVVECGAWVVVAASLAVPRATRPSEATWNTSLAIGPKEDRDEWEADMTPGATASGEDVAIFQIRGGRVLRFTDF